MRTSLLTVTIAVLGALAAAAALAQSPPVPAAAPPGSTESVSLRQSFVNGQTFSYSFVITAQLRQSGPQSPEPVQTTTTHTGSLRLNVLDVDAEGVATLSAVIPALTIALEDARGASVAAAARPDEPDEPGPEPDPKAEPDPADETSRLLASVARALTRAVIRFDVTPEGNVRRIIGLDAAAEAAAADSDIGPIALGVFAPGSITRTFERLWLLDAPLDDAEDAALPESWPRRAAGNQWTLRDARPLAYGEIAGIARTHTLERLPDPESPDKQFQVVMSGTGRLPGKRADPDPTVPALTLTTWEERGSAVWNSAANRIARRDETVITELTAALGDRSRTSRVQMKLTFEALNPGEPAPASP